MPTTGIGNLDRKRASADRKLPDTCSVYQVANADDGEGGQTQTFTLRGSPVACRFATLSGRELERAKQIAASADTVVTMPDETVVEGTDRIVITKAEGGATYDVEVKHVVNRSQNITRRVLTTDLTP